MPPVKTSLTSLSAALLLLVAPVALSSARTPAGRTAPPEGQSPFAIIDLGTLGGSSSRATAVNARGQVVGGSATASSSGHAFSWTQAGGMIDLGASTDPSVPGYTSAAAVNEAGQVVGSAADGMTASAFSWTQTGGMITFGPGGSSSGALGANGSGQVVGNSAGGMLFRSAAYLWTPAGGVVSVGTLPGGGSTYGRAVNDAGQVVGDASTDSFYPYPTHAFSWTQAGGMVDLGTIGGSGLNGASSRAFAVNNAGEVVGESTYLGYVEHHAFSWTQAGGMVDLGTLGGGFSQAVAVNSAGQVVGWGIAGDGAEHAFSWTQAGAMIDLGTLGGSSSRALAVNDGGEVVGQAQDLYGYEHAFSWTPAGGMVDLGTLGGSSSQAVAINNAGQIVGTSDTGSGGATPFHHAVLWERGCVVRDVGGKTLAPTRLALARANCTVGTIKRIYSRQKKGLVLAQSPKPWTRLAASAPVRLTVSKGRPKPHRQGLHTPR
jgi:probable HAF family extracellular repeat protein